LRLTFKSEIANGKVILINKMLGDSISNTMTTINEIYSNYPTLSFVKMDIEGCEQIACAHSFDWLKFSETPVKMVICTYHSQYAYDELVNMLRPICQVETSSGYMCVSSILGKPFGKFYPPYVRRGVIRIEKVS